MLEFVVDNIFVVFAGKVFQQTVGIRMGTNCAPLLADFFLKFCIHTKRISNILRLFALNGKEIVSISVHSHLQVHRLCIVHKQTRIRNYLGQMYSAELEIEDTTTSASYLDLLLSIGRDSQLHTSIYDKQDDFNFHITNFPFPSSNIPSSRPKAFLFLNLYDTPGLAPCMNASF